MERENKLLNPKLDPCNILINVVYYFNLNFWFRKHSQHESQKLFQKQLLFKTYFLPDTDEHDKSLKSITRQSFAKRVYCYIRGSIVFYKSSSFLSAVNQGLIFNVILYWSVAEIIAFSERNPS